MYVGTATKGSDTDSACCSVPVRTEVALPTSGGFGVPMPMSVVRSHISLQSFTAAGPDRRKRLGQRLRVLLRSRPYRGSFADLRNS